MSNIYVQEPMTKGKVLLKTSVGDVDVELWSKEAPRACRNFIQLCLEGYYDNTTFHRIVKNFIVQAGDPTGTGTGGESIYGEPFIDEFHSRLRFRHRGIVAMANTGSNTNKSQFFITLDRCDGLERKHTIFGKVTGDTIFNVLKMGDYEVDKDERPIYPIYLISTEVIWNPFEDIVPRPKPKPASPQHQVVKAKPAKNLSLLSFDDDVEEVAPVANNNSVKMKSVHHFSDDPRVRTFLAEQERLKKEDEEYLKQIPKKIEQPQQQQQQRQQQPTGEIEASRDFDVKMRAKVQKKRLELHPTNDSSKEENGIGEDHSKETKEETEVKKDKENKDDNADDEDEDEDEDTETNKNEDKSKQLYDGNRLLAEQRQKYLKKRFRPDTTEDEISTHKGKRKKDPRREQEIFEKLSLFRESLKSATPLGAPKAVPKPEPIIVEIHTTENDQELPDNDKSWLVHRLAFEKTPQVIDPMARNEEDHYTVYDPLKDPLQNNQGKPSAANKHTRHLARLGPKNVEKW